MWHVACGKWQVGHKYASISCAHTHTCTRWLNALNSVFGSAQLRDTLYAILVLVFPHTHTHTNIHSYMIFINLLFWLNRALALTLSLTRSLSLSRWRSFALRNVKILRTNRFVDSLPLPSPTVALAALPAALRMPHGKSHVFSFPLRALEKVLHSCAGVG